MNQLQSTFVLNIVDAIALSAVVIVVAVLTYRYLSSTANLRFQAREARAVRKQAALVSRREERIKVEELRLANVDQYRLNSCSEV